VGPHLPVDLVVGQGQRLVAAEVPVDAAGAQVGARQAVLLGHVGRDDADAAGAGLEDLVAEHEVFHLVAEVAQLLHHLLGLGDPALGQVVLEAADAVEVRVEAAAGGASIWLSTYSRSRKA
jgi:hypothetical protein